MSLPDGAPRPTAQPRTQRAPGHYWADNEVVDEHLPEIGIYAFGVYMLLCRFADSRTGRCTPSIATLARRLGIAELTVKKALRTLSAAGLISVSRRSVERDGARQHLSHVYTLLAVAKCRRAGSSALEEQPPCQTNDDRATVEQVSAGETGPAGVDSPQIPTLDQMAIPVDHEPRHLQHAPQDQTILATTPVPHPAIPGDQATIPLDHPVIPNKTPGTTNMTPPPHTPLVVEDSYVEIGIPAASPSPQGATSAASYVGTEIPVASSSPGFVDERQTLLQAMGVTSAKARTSLATVGCELILAWKQVLDDVNLRQALTARGIADPVAFAVAALRDGTPPPDPQTLRRWLVTRSAAGASARGTESGVRSVSAIPPDEWAAMSTADRHAIIAAQAQRVNWRAAR